MATVAIVPTPEGETDETEVSWESALSEIRAALSEGFNSLREEFRSQIAEANRLSSQLLEANTRLTEMITSHNQTLTDRLASLTPSVLPTPEVTLIVPTDTPSLEGGEIDPSEVAPEPEPVARRKRRTL